MARNEEQTGEKKGTSNRGFASMDREKQRQIASKGGQSVPPEKRSFSQDPNLAAQAGRKGGESVPAEGRSFSQNRELAAEAGRKGGQARGAMSQRAKAKQQSMPDNGGSEADEASAENRQIAAAGGRPDSIPKDQQVKDERSRFPSGGQGSEHDTRDLEERNDLRSDKDTQGDYAPMQRGSGTGRPHNIH